MSFMLSLATRIVADESIPAIRNAADIFHRDLRENLTERGSENRILVSLVDTLSPESWQIQIEEEKITVQAGDDLGAVYALLEISRRGLDVQPFDWWMDRHPVLRPQAEIPCGIWTSVQPAVRFRGWFVNDEVLFTGWHQEESQRFHVWKRLFECLLRCGGNMIIPGTDRAIDGEKLCQAAQEMGLWLTHHHTEILGARMFARVYPDLQPSYALHPEKYEALWDEAVQKYAGTRVVWAVGFRGQGDRPFWEDDPTCDTPEKQGAVISRLIRRQMEIVRVADPNAHFVTNLYGEMMSLYRQGWIDLPPEVARIWGDNGFGRMISRRQINLNPRVDAMPKAGAGCRQGIYYHVSFYDMQAANHITMLQIPPKDVVRELREVLARGGGDFWNINVGSVKPHLFMMEILRQMWLDGSSDSDTAAAAFAARYYGNPEAGQLFTGYAKHAIAYGPNPDDRAGDQYYHFPLREMARALMCGETEGPVETLRWASSADSFVGQVQDIAHYVAPGQESWKKFVSACRRQEDSLSPAEADRLENTLTLAGILHQTGCESLYAFCQTCGHTLNGNLFQAFLWAGAALTAAQKGVTAMDSVGGRFAHIYDNDCFVGVRLTCRVLKTLMGWLRIQGDTDMLGVTFYSWEKAWLIPPEENRVLLQTHRTVQLADEELYHRLRGDVPMQKAF